MAKQTTRAARRRDGFRRAICLVRDVCNFAGMPSLIEDARVDLARAGVLEAIRRHDNAPVFDWLMEAISYQGISDAAAFTYMETHGRVHHGQVEQGLQQLKCPKLQSWWDFEDCGYRKTARTCKQQKLLRSCPLPSHDLRNGSLSQAAYALALFLRDVAGDDLVAWIDQRFEQADKLASTARGKAMAASVIEPLRYVHGLSDKVLSMSLSMLLTAGDPDRERWVTAGASMVAIDTLVHNWFVRTGILRQLESEHPYGARCYSEGGCASIIEHVSKRIDARRFNSDFPAYFPRFVQHAVWQFCAQSGRDECNGNRIDDRKRCQRAECELFHRCGRVALNPRARSAQGLQPATPS